MKTLFTFILLIALSISAQFSQAQDKFGTRLFSLLQHKIFLLDKTEALDYLSGKPDVISLHQKAPYLDTLLAQGYSGFSEILPPGYYVICHPTATDLHYQYFFKPPFIVSMQKVNGQYRLYINDLNGKPVEDAKVQYGNKTFSYEPVYMAVALPEKLAGKRLYITDGKEFMYFIFSKVKERENWGGTGSGMPKPGFMVLSKPLYRIMDTVKGKAFVFDGNGYPARDKLRYSLQRNGKIMFSESIKPVAPGAYEFQIYLPDTLEIERQYDVILEDTYHGQKLSQSFKLTQYKLDWSTFIEGPIPAEIKPAETFRLFPAAIDPNGMPVPGAKCNLKIKLGKVHDLNGELLELEEKAFTDYFIDTTFLLDPSGQTVFELPASEFPEADLELSWQMSLFSTEGERKTFKERTCRRYLEGNYCNISLKENEWLIEGPKTACSVFILDFFGKIKEEKVLLPHRFPLDQNQKKIWVMNDNRILSEVLTATLLDEEPEFIGTKTFDSLFLKLLNPYHEQVSWRIHFRNEFQLNGYGTKLDLAVPLKGNDPVYIEYTYHRQMKYKVAEKVIESTRNRLYVIVNTEETVFPGQNAILNIEVRNNRNRGVKNVNLTAWAINTQFRDFEWPEMPDYGVKGSPRLSKMPAIINHGFAGNNRISCNEQMLLKYSIDPEIAFWFPGTGIGYLKDTLSQEKTEVAFFGFDRNRLRPTQVWIDDTLRYHEQLGVSVRWSLPIAPGQHHIRLRFHNFYITLPQVNIEKGFKNMFCINKNLLKVETGASIINMEYPVTIDELGDESGRFIRILDANYMGQGAMICDQRQCQPLSTKNFSFYRNNRYYYFAQAGPFYGDTLRWISRDSVDYFPFVPGSTMTLVEGKLQTAGISLPFMASPAKPEWNLSDSAIYPVSKVEQAALKVANSEIEKTIFTSLHRNYVPLEYSGVTLHILDPDQKLNKIWLFNKKKPKASIIQFYNQLHFENIEVGLYDIVLGTTNDRYYVFKDITLDSQKRYLLKPDTTCFFEFEQVTLKPFLEKIESLHMPDFLPLIQLPLQLYPKIDFFPNVEDNLYIKGRLFISGDEYHGAIVLCEQKGEFRGGARTNSAGIFRIDVKEPGEYDLKIVLKDLRVFTAKDIEVKQSYFTEVAFYGYPGSVGYTHRPIKIKPVQARLSGSGEIRGIIKDNKTHEPMDFVNIVCFQNGYQIQGGQTNQYGKYSFENLSPGAYTIVIKFVGYEDVQVYDVIVKSDMITFLDIQMQESLMSLSEVTIKEYKNPIIRADDNGKTIWSDQIRKVPSRSPNGVANMSSGVFSMDGETPSFRGARTAGTAYYINGVMVIGSSSLPQNAIGYTGDGMNFLSPPDHEKEKSRMNLLIGDTSLNKTRSDFRDVAYWIPNVWTGKNGKISLQIKYPENPTQWRHVIPAIHRKKKTGLGVAYTKSYKPIQAGLALPPFVLAGDRLNLYGKMVNYTGDTIEMQSRFSRNGKQVAQENVKAGISHTQYYSFTHSAEDTLSLEWNFDLPNGYKDGELKKLPVLYDGMVVSKGVHTMMNGDTTITYIPKEGTNDRYLLIGQNYRSLMLYHLKKLQGYRYGCAEQTASKLKALILEKKFAGLLGLEWKSEKDKEVVFMIKRLEKFQNVSGSWGWWEKSTPYHWISIHVTEALIMAEKEGYRSKSLEQALVYLSQNYQNEGTYSELQTMEILADYPHLVSIKIDSVIRNYEQVVLSKSDLYRLMAVKQKLGMSIDLDSIARSAKSDGKGGLYWDEGFTGRLRFNRTLLSMQAYRLLAKEPAYSSLLGKVQKHFLINQTGNYNTIQTAEMLASLFETSGNDKAVKSEITVNGKVVDDFPAKIKFSSTDTIEISSQGGLFILSYIYEERVKEFVSDSGKYTLTSRFVQNNSTGDTLRFGQSVQMEIDVEFPEKQEFVMVEIPIPAGFYYESKEKSPGEEHREYFDNQVSVFYSRVSAGKKSITVNLIPRFTGEMKVLPPRIEPMYEPEKSGYGNRKRVVVVD